MNTFLKTSITLLFAGAGSMAQAADYEDFGRVVSVAPQIEQVNQPRQECRTEYVPVQTQQRSGGGGSVVGAVVGGLLGSQVGGGNGRIAAAAVGAATGAVIGDRADAQGNTVTTSEQPVRQCRTVDSWSQRTNGYLVTYEYRGHTQTAVMPYDPGERLKLRVAITPVLR